MSVSCTFLSLFLSLFLSRFIADAAERKNVGVGYALHFEGIAPLAGLKKGFIDFNDPGIDIDTEATMSMWYRSYVESRRSMYTLHWTHDAEPQFFEPFNTNGAFMFGAFTNYRSGLLENFPDFNVSDWNHYAVTYRTKSIDPFGDFGFCEWFVNGISVHNFTVRGGESMEQKFTTFFIGPALQDGVDVRVRANTGSSPRGVIDDVALYSRALSREEIGLIYAENPQSVPGELMLYYDFEPRCNTQPDTSCLEVENAVVLTGDGYNLLRGAIGSNVDEYLEANGDVDRDEDECVVPRTLADPQFVLSSRVVVGTPLATALVAVVQDGKSVDFASVEAVDMLQAASLPLSAGASLEHFNTASLLQIGDNFTELNVTFGVADVLSFGLVSGRQVHIYRAVAPFVPATLEISAVVDARTVVNLLELAESPFGERLLGVVLETPSSSEAVLTQVERDGRAGIVNSGGDVIKDGDSATDLTGFIHVALQREVTTTFRYRVVSATTGLSSDCVVTIVPLEVDILPTTLPLKTTFNEDSEIVIDLASLVNDTDSRNIFSVISTLPQNGKLFKQYQDGRIIQIEFPYDQKVDAGLEQQYVFDVNRASSFWGVPPDLDYHALNIIGPPLCELAGECSDSRPVAPDGSLLMVKHLELVQVHAVDGDPSSGLVPGKVLKIHTGDDEVVYELQLLVLQVDGQPCLMSSGYYTGDEPGLEDLFPVGCAPIDPESIHRNVSQFGTMFSLGNAAWSPRRQFLLLSGNVTSQSTDAFGSRFFFQHAHGQTYNDAEPVKYTEFIEVEFENKVYIEEIEIGSSRGSGAVVQVKGMDNSGEWDVLWSGTVRKEESSVNAKLGRYSNFNVPTCKPAYSTNKLRIETDTTEESGISDWNYLNHVKLSGLQQPQTAVIELTNDASLSPKLIYRPNPNFNGPDTFTFQSTDCGGDPARLSAETVITLDVTPVNDAPVFLNPPVTVDAVNKQTALIPLLISDPDGEEIVPTTVTVGAPNVTGGLRLFAITDTSSGCPQSEAETGKPEFYQLLGDVFPVVLNETCPILRVESSCETSGVRVVRIPITASDGTNETRHDMAISLDCSNYQELLEIVQLTIAFISIAAAFACVYACFSKKRSSWVVDFLYRVTSPMATNLFTMMLQLGDFITDLLVLLISVQNNAEIDEWLVYSYVGIMVVATAASVYTLLVRTFYMRHICKSSWRRKPRDLPRDSSVHGSIVVQPEHQHEILVLEKYDIQVRANKVQIVFIMLVCEDLPVAVLNLIIIQQDPTLLQDDLFRFSFIFGLVMAGIKIYKTLQIRTLRDELRQITEYLEST